MSRLETAQKRFQEALTRLQTTFGDRMAALLTEAGEQGAELEELRAERERLSARIAALEEDGRALAGLSQDVEDRLDSAIAEIRDALGRH